MRGAAEKRLAAAESGAKLCKNSPTAECVKAAVFVVLAGEEAARVSSGVT